VPAEYLIARASIDAERLRMITLLAPPLGQRTSR
jgi:hypothetical protein